MVETKKYRRFYPFYSRYLALFIRVYKEAEAIAAHMMTCVNVMIMIQAEHLEEEIQIFLFLLRRFSEARDQLLVEGPRVDRRRILRIPRTITSFPTNHIGNLFRFRSHDALRRLLAIWDFPLAPNGKVLISNCGHYMHNEELLLSSIRRLASKNTIDEICRIDMKNMEYSKMSRGFRYFVTYTREKFSHKLSNQCLTFFENRFPLYAEAIRVRCNEKGGTNFAPNQFFIVGFIDCTNTGVARPGAGPIGKRCNTHNFHQFYH